jgi:PhnB protein
MAAKKKKKPAPKTKKKAAKKKVGAIPKRYHSVTPFIVVHDASAALDWYAKAFGGKVLSRMPGPDGKIMHSEILIGDSVLVLTDEMPGMGVRSAKTMGGSPATLMLYTGDVDASFARATAAGAKVVMAVADQFWGDRYGQIEDPFGYRWAIATHTKDMTPKQLQVAQDEFFASMAAMGQQPPAG